ncbi:crk-like protein isoform X1 [Lytechinus variegatus]|uniref:crk-like protein isoform X1 n=1 Tax=Lytechinus variegatus TaxID=7654 RepID=UPI001BB1BCCB|nr:crk-like protein isoform X1 [Lytechinus variegatus]
MASQDDLKTPYDDNNKHLWHFGGITRGETDNLLIQKRPGTFLVRDSRTCPGDSVLCVSENSKVSHYIITRKGDQFVIGDQIFSTLPDILNFYRGHYLDTTVLVEPCPKRQMVAQPPPQSPAPTSQEKLNDRAPPTPKPEVPPVNPTPPPSIPPSNAERFRVKYTFTSDDSDDLPAQKNEILTLVNRDEADWWTMRNGRGQEGQFPVPWMEALPVEPPPEVYRSVTSYGKAIQRRIPNAYDTTQLKFEKGDIVKVVKQHMSGYWEGELLKDGAQGFFPFTFVEILPPEEADKILQGHSASQNGMEGNNSLLN